VLPCLHKLNPKDMIKTDLYTKVILTAIALFLGIISLSQLQLIPSLHASENPSSSLDLPNYSMVPVNADGSINVRMETMDVRIVDINTYDLLPVKISDIATSDLLNVNLKDVDTYEAVPVDIKKVSTSDELPVNIDEIGNHQVMFGQLPVVIEK
jgi:hypothetical protein